MLTYKQLKRLAEASWPDAVADGRRYDIAYIMHTGWGPERTAQRLVYLGMRLGYCDEEIARMVGAVEAIWERGRIDREDDAPIASRTVAPSP